jgi:para-nitrobenzyl esterase
MVWLHGGGFSAESGGSAGYDQYYMAKLGNVVAVSVNHRLNIFGYSYLGDRNDEFATSGNAGQLDLVAALQWVRDNIANFGGDPSNVTIYGESGGGGKVSTLIAMPAARGLFHKAIVQSGSFLKIKEAPEAWEVTERAAAFLDIKPDDVAALQAVSQERLLDALRHVSSGRISGRRRSYAPVIDHHVLMQHPWSPAAPAYASQIPMMIGTTSDEIASIAGSKDVVTTPADDTELLARISNYLTIGNVSDEQLPGLLKHYRQVMPEMDDRHLWVRMATDAGFLRSALLQAKAKIEGGGPPVFLYNYAWKTPWLGTHFAVHGVELPFVFGQRDFPSWGDGDSPELRAADDPNGDRYRLITQTLGAWAAFAHNGDPSTPSLKWPAYNLETHPTMVFDRETRVVNDPNRVVRTQLMALRGV